MDKTRAFADLGIPFRLYEAPIESCSDFVGNGQCSLCQGENKWIFDAGIGDSLLVSCSNCGETNALSCLDKEDIPCTRCAVSVVWPLSRQGGVQVCYDCLRAGRVWFTQDTQLGMVRWQDAERGRTHGIPLDVNTGLASQPKEEDPDWHEFFLEREDANELGRTPGYTTWQGERWPFHCGRVMIYIGEPMTRPQNEVAPEIVAATLAVVESEGWNINGLDLWNSSLCAYLFRCGVCGALDGHADCD